jgi:hypothetical protein
MAYATLDNLVLVEPTITEYGVVDWDAELARSEVEINRILQVRWWPMYQKDRGGSLTFTSTLLTETQWTQATVYHALAYHIAPKLTKFEQQGNEDKFQVMMKYYQGRFEHEMDLCLRLGVEYDLDNNNTVSTSEKDSYNQLKLTR